MSDSFMIHDADVRVMDPAGTRASAIAVKDGLVLAVGTRAEVARAAGEVPSFDAAGATVLPGFIDAHHHPCIVALYGGQVRLGPPRVTDVASLQATLAAAAAELPAGRWLVATDWDEMLLAERRAPTRSELDEAVPDRPLLALHYTCHRAALNSRALTLAGVGRHTPDPAGGAISRARGGLPDGILIERAMSRAESLARASLVAHDAEGFLERLAAHHRALVAAGITRVVDATVPGDLAVLYREAARRALLLVPTVMMPVSSAGWLEEPWDALEGPLTGEEDGPLSVGPLKLVFDGAPACSMCLGVWQGLGLVAGIVARSLRERSLDPIRISLSARPRVRRDLALETGIAIYRRDEAETIVRAAADRGFALAIHAIGNEAVDVALSAYEATRASVDRAGIPRIEHAWFLSRDLVARIAGAGAAVVAQPHFVELPAFGSAPSIPGLRGSPLRWLLDAGVRVAGSSDHPVASFEPLDGIRSATGRRTRSGGVYEPDQRITLEEALSMYTRGAAEVCGRLDRSGTLAPGKRADVVILDRALAGGLEDAAVRATIIGGTIVFGELGAAGRAPA